MFSEEKKVYQHNLINPTCAPSLLDSKKDLIISQSIDNLIKIKDILVICHDTFAHSGSSILLENVERILKSTIIEGIEQVIIDLEGL